jgi:DNA-directed RNA polymerase specialized sigma subunit
MKKHEEFVKKSGEKLSYLTPREQKILRMFYGVEQESQNLAEIAAHFDVSVSTISLVKRKALRKLENVKVVS